MLLWLANALVYLNRLFEFLFHQVELFTLTSHVSKSLPAIRLASRTIELTEKCQGVIEMSSGGFVIASAKVDIPEAPNAFRFTESVVKLAVDAECVAEVGFCFQELKSITRYPTEVTSAVGLSLLISLLVRGTDEARDRSH